MIPPGSAAHGHYLPSSAEGGRGVTAALGRPEDRGTPRGGEVEAGEAARDQQSRGVRREGGTAVPLRIALLLVTSAGHDTSIYSFNTGT